MEKVRFQFENNKYSVLNYVYFLPDIKRYLISICKLFEQSYRVVFNNNLVHISWNGSDICSENLENGLYFVKSMSNSLLPVKMFIVVESKNKKAKDFSWK